MSGQKNLLTIHPLVLAWVGDAVFASRVRSMYALTTDFKAGVLQRKANKYVSAVGQSVWYDLLSPGFTEEEEDIARRAKNAHNNTVAKNATVEEYKKASALEAVVGYHSLKGDEARIDELFARIFADRAR